MGWVTWAAAAVLIVVFAGAVVGVFRRRRRRSRAITPEGFRRALDAMSPGANRAGEGTTSAPTEPTSSDPRRVRSAAKPPTATGNPEPEGN